MPPASRITRMTRLPGLWLAASSGSLLAGVVFAYISLGLIYLNLEEIRSLPNTYVWAAKGFLTLWLAGTCAALAALRGWAEWPARVMVLLSTAIFGFDLGRGLWLSSWPQIGLAAAVEIVFVAMLCVAIWRMPIRRLLDCAQLLAISLVIVTVALHVNAVGPRLLWNAAKEIVRPTTADARTHPDPWATLPADAGARGQSPDVASIVPAHSGVTVNIGENVQLSNSDGPGATIAALPLRIPASSGRAVLTVDLKLIEGDVGVGLRHPATAEWYYRQEAKIGDGARQTLVLPLYPGANRVDVLFTNGRVGRESFAFEIEEANLHVDTRVDTHSATGNVYHIILDAFDIETFVKVTAEQPELFPADFVLYDQFRTSQPATEWSLPTIFSGAYYEQESGLSGDAWRSETYQEGLASVLEQADVPAYQYTWFSSQCADQASYCHSSQDYRHELLSQVADNFVLDLTFLRALPNSVRAILVDSVNRQPVVANGWDYGFSLTSKLGQGSVQTSEDHILKDFYYSLNLFTIGFFKQMLIQEVQRPGSGHYIFFHAMVPHSPYARDSECAFIPIAARTSENLEKRIRGQAVCALHLVRWLIEQLKLLERYDDALIIVHADHGRLKKPESETQFRLDQIGSDEWPAWAVDSLAAGLLMVKWPRASAGGSTPAPAQTVDIAPTILQHFGISQPARHIGKPLQHLEADARRELVFYANSRPLIGTSAERLSKYVKPADGDWAFAVDVPTKP